MPFIQFLLQTTVAMFAIAIVRPDAALAVSDCVDAVNRELEVYGMGSYSNQRNCVVRRERPKAAAVDFDSKVMGTSVTHRKFLRERSGQAVEIKTKDLLGNENYKIVFLKSCSPKEVRFKLGNSPEVIVNEFTCKTERAAHTAICDQYFPNVARVRRVQPETVR